MTATRTNPLYAHLRDAFGTDPEAAARWIIAWYDDSDGRGQRDPLRPDDDDAGFTVRAMAYHCSRVLEGCGYDPYVDPVEEMIRGMSALNDGDGAAAMQHVVASVWAVAEGHRPGLANYLDTRWGPYLAHSAWSGVVQDPGDWPDRRGAAT